MTSLHEHGNSPSCLNLLQIDSSEIIFTKIEHQKINIFFPVSVTKASNVECVFLFSNPPHINLNIQLYTKTINSEFIKVCQESQCKPRISA